jgi:aspartate-semialdehyde dehydrogenase
MSDSKLPVGILGATGTVGQRFIELLQDHPLFYIKAIGASSRSAGKSFSEACNWKMTTPIPENISKMAITLCESKYFQDCRVIFSGLDASVAGQVELEFMENEFCVFSNAKNHRMNPLVPLIVPTVNPEHFDLIEQQRKHYKLNKGFIVTNANCSSTGLVAALKPLQQAFGNIRRVVVVTMQAISGAGYPGVPSLDILGNVVPFIPGEESKMEEEAHKILGTLNKDRSEILNVQDMRISASCNRVPVIEGHTESVFVEFEKKPAPSIDEIKKAFKNYTSQAQTLNCYSAPKNCVMVMSQPDRPQPRLDCLLDNGSAVLVGGLRECNIFDVKFTLLVHNTILGAAGSSIMNAEIAFHKKLL